MASIFPFEILKFELFEKIVLHISDISDIIVSNRDRDYYNIKVLVYL